MRQHRLFVVTAIIEVGAGLALLVAPAILLRLVFDTPSSVPATGVARLAGVALLSLGAACWYARDAEWGAASRALGVAMLTYNAGVAALVLAGALGALGLLQWSALLIHAAMAIWCARVVAAR